LQPGEKTPLIGAAPAARAAEEKAAPLLGVPPPLLELAVASSDALRALTASGAMARLLPHTRIWARTKPEDKAAIVSMFVELGMVSTMVGDGGNDCGALRTAHAGLALSEAEASVVSPFTSCTWSIRSVVDLVREGRAALATAFGSYKFLIIYGQFFAVLKLTCFWYGVILCNAIYLLIDTVTVMGLTAAMALSLPQQRLLPTRPPASLLGARVVSSVLVMQAINVCFFGAQLHAMKSDPDYVRWPSALSVGPSWWELGDNWECTVIFAAVYPPFVASSLAFSIGGAFRRPVLRNFVLVGITAALLCLASLLVLLPPCPLTRVFHMASEQFNTPCPSSCYPADAPVDASLFDYAAADCDACPRNAVWLAYQQPAPFGGGGAPSAAMGFPFRLRLWAASALECVLLVCVELVLGGRGFEALRARLGLRKPNTRPVFVP
jgi:cation-transporting ATPase 13A3/4/5